MIGDKQIWEARRAGTRPTCAWVQLGAAPPACLSRFDNPEAMLGQQCYPTVYLPAAELDTQQDWRFLQGMRVMVEAADTGEIVTAQIEDMVKDGAAVVVLNTPDTMMVYDGGGWQAWVF